jgi:hypothetical protein
LSEQSVNVAAWVAMRASSEGASIMQANWRSRVLGSNNVQGVK